MESPRWSRLALLYAGTVFVSAFLLFQVQPLISRFILPWFGGTPAVWSTCLVFFQTMLFAGYAYAHLSEHYFRPRVRTIVHLALIVAALCTLPIAPSDWWKPTGSEHPAARILALLAVCVGLPYFVLSSTGPLVQAWFSQTLPGKSPYRLYSLSNLGSLLALLSYPFVFEPMLDGQGQSWWWTAGFVLFCILCGVACWQTARLRHGAAAVTAAEISTNDEPAPTWLRRLLWLLLPAFASILLLATTNHICQDMPSAPFLWIAPLSLYLVSFIIAFDHERWYRRLPYALGAMVCIYLTAGMHNPREWGSGWLALVHLALSSGPSTPWSPVFGFRAQLFWQLAGLFLMCMLCHGELVRLRPPPRYLTSFYLMIAAGGALGGLLVSLVAPLVFKTFAEWKIGLIIGFGLAAAVAFVLTDWTARQRGLNWRGGLRIAGIALALPAFAETVHLMRRDEISKFSVLEQTRNFYGVLSVVNQKVERANVSFNILYSGWTRHGLQINTPDERRQATTYFSERSGIGQTLEHYKSAHASNPLRVGVVGLGVGTLAAYVDMPWHTIRFYEINPDDCRLADQYFTFLSDARLRGAKVEIVEGDARLSLERELGKPQEFDVLVLDAFSSDAIPMHLLTKEAFDVYLKHLAPGGAIAAHVTNRNINLAPIVYGLAEANELEPVRLRTADIEHAGWPTEWIILSRNQSLLTELRGFKDNAAPAPLSPPFPLWTDQRHNLLEVLR